MSRKVCVQFEVREALIMKDTLNQLGYDFTEKSQDVLAIQAAYYPIEIDCTSGTMSHDSGAQTQVDKIKQTYMVNFYRDKAIKEGMQIQEEVKSNGEVIIHLNQ